MINHWRVRVIGTQAAPPGVNIDPWRCGLSAALPQVGFALPGLVLCGLLTFSPRRRLLLGDTVDVACNKQQNPLLKSLQPERCWVS